jgi:hypothetical protein
MYVKGNLLIYLHKFRGNLNDERSVGVEIVYLTYNGIQTAGPSYCRRKLDIEKREKRHAANCKQFSTNRDRIKTGPDSGPVLKLGGKVR